MGKYLPDHVRLKIVTLKQSGVNVTNIVRVIEADGVTISRNAVYDTVATLQPPPRPRKGVTKELLDFIDQQMEMDDELTAKTLSLRINQEFEEKFSISKVKDLRKKLGWLAEKTRYCQMVREANRIKRREFAQLCIDNKDNFDNVIWTDECNVQLDWNGVLTFHRWWEPCP